VYIGNGEAKEFPLPEGKSGEEVYFLPDGGTSVRLNGTAYRIEGDQDKKVVFEIPPPEGVTISFEPNGNTGMSGICIVIYPDGTVKEITEDPYELLVEAKAERDEAKKLLKAAMDASEKNERFVKIETDIAREKLSARAEKYATLVDDSVKSAAAAAGEAVKEAMEKQIEEAKEIEARTAAVLGEIQTLLYEAKSAARSAADDAAEAMRERCARAEEAVSEIRSVKENVAAMRTEAANAAANAGADINRLYAGLVEGVIEEIRGMRAAIGSETAAALEKTRAEAQGMTAEARNALSEIRANTASAAAIERRLVEIDETQKTREAGMKALWERMTEFRKRLDSRKAREEV
jgi:hypothetical protein